MKGREEVTKICGLAETENKLLLLLVTNDDDIAIIPKWWQWIFITLCWCSLTLPHILFYNERVAMALSLDQFIFLCLKWLCIAGCFFFFFFWEDCWMLFFTTNISKMIKFVPSHPCLNKFKSNIILFDDVVNHVMYNWRKKTSSCFHRTKLHISSRG